MFGHSRGQAGIERRRFALRMLLLTIFGYCGVVSASPPVSEPWSNRSAELIPSLTLVSDDGDAYCADIALNNVSASATLKWKVKFTVSGAIAAAEGAVVTQSGTSVAASGLSGQTSLAPGASLSFSVCGFRSGSYKSSPKMPLGTPWSNSSTSIAVDMRLTSYAADSFCADATVVNVSASELKWKAAVEMLGALNDFEGAQVSQTENVAYASGDGDTKLALPNEPIRYSICALLSNAPVQLPTLDAHILVDQFGYRPEDSKVAVIRNPVSGYDISASYLIGSRYEVRNADDNAAVFSGNATAWNGGSTQASSGDMGWWFDFSTLVTPGRYYVYDVDNKLRSPLFNIGSDVYKDVLKAATRTYFYQRSGFAKQQPYAEACWVDDAAYLGANQDTQARDITDPYNASKTRDVSGGWFDAGDTNKYVSFAMQPVHQLLTAYQEVPSVFTDDFNIPESGNGIPDLIDEVKWEIDWLKKMQFSDGSAALKVGKTAYTSATPPSIDTAQRYYVPACTSSTIAVAGMFAHAAYTYGKVSQMETRYPGEISDLTSRAIKAWAKYQATPTKQTNCDTQTIQAGDADMTASEQQAESVVAAIYLFALTGSSSYHDYIKANYRLLRPYSDMGWSRYVPEQGEALLFYTTLSGADPTLKAQVLADKAADVKAGNKIYGFVANDDLYRAYLHDAQYHWGSHNPRASYGNTNVDVLTYSIAVDNTASHSQRAQEILHYFHGVNPFGIVYLSNMYDYGATNSVDQIFHSWFWDGSIWDDALTSSCGPAPGFVPGGPVANATNYGVPSYIVPPAGQPAQKSYHDWNADWPESSYVVNEPGIYYQSPYLKLLAHFVGSSGSGAPPAGFKLPWTNRTDALSAAMTLTADDGYEYCGAITVSNRSATEAISWQAKFEVPGFITSNIGAELSQSGAQVTGKGLVDDLLIAPNSSTAFSFCGRRMASAYAQPVQNLVGNKGALKFSTEMMTDDGSDWCEGVTVYNSHETATITWSAGFSLSGSMTQLSYATSTQSGQNYTVIGNAAFGNVSLAPGNSTRFELCGRR